MHTSVTEMEASWSFEDLYMANDVLDILEDAEARAVKRNG